MQGIGYKEVAEGLRLGQSLEEIAETIKKNTRNYAKRQLTFFKRMENHVLLAPERANAQNVLELLKNQ
jgi:tRNA dimethylallyltransferase